METTLQITIGILIAVFAIIVYEIRKTIKEAKEVIPSYILNTKTRELHHVSCPRIKDKKNKKNLVYIDEEDIKMITNYKNCKRCGGFI